MTDTTFQNGPDSRPPAEEDGISGKVQRTIRKRYAAERRFKAYGVGAIFLALSFLAFLFVDIISNGISAFRQVQVKLEVDLDAATIDPKGDASEESFLAGDFRSVVQTGFKKLLPEVRGRSDRKASLELISNGAQYTLQDLVTEDPSLIGKKVSVWVNLSDDADVFAKGRVTDVSKRPGTGTASPSGITGEIRILSSSEDFAAILEQVKQNIRDQVSILDRTIDRLDTQIAQLEQSIMAGAGDVEALTDDLELAKYQQKRTHAKAETLRSRAQNTQGEETLSADLPSYLVEINGGVVKVISVQKSEMTGEVWKPLKGTDPAQQKTWEIISYLTPESDRRLGDKEVTWLRSLEDRGLIELNFNTTLFTAGDSQYPEQAGIWGAVIGSFFTLAVTLLLSFPIGVMTAVYLEEFAPKNRLTDFIEVNINNLAAVPSIVFGLLGLAVFLNFFGLPRSAPVVGGLVLTLMTLPTIIIASRAALKAVPPSIRGAALGMGASRLQAMTHHTLPLAMPGMLTGTIIGMAQALGETAPLLMIGMVAFIADIPGGPTDPATVLPAQIYLWAVSSEQAFVERTSAAIMVLLGFLIFMNLMAVLLRKRFERRW